MHVSLTVDDIAEINSGGSGHPVIAFPLHLISESVTMVTAYPTASHQIVIFLSGARQCTPPPSPLFHGAKLPKSNASPPAKSQLLSELCVYTVVLAVLFIMEIFGSKPMTLLY